jgi:hypothetical protein
MQTSSVSCILLILLSLRNWQERACVQRSARITGTAGTKMATNFLGLVVTEKPQFRWHGFDYM